MTVTPTIFYLDDEQGLCDIVGQYCALANFSVSTFVDAETALDACKQSPPQIFFIDYRLTNTVGDEVAIKVPDDIIKILVTGELTIPRIEAFDFVLKKPFQYKQFKNLVSECLACND